jgi:hypothetical protein
MTDDEFDQCIAEVVWWAAITAERADPAADAERMRFLRAVWQKYLRRRTPPDDPD